MQDTIFEVNFPLSQAPSLFPILQRIHHPHVEGCNTFTAPRPMVNPNYLPVGSKPPISTFSMPDFFGTEEDLLSSSPIFFDSPKSESDFSEPCSDSDLEKEFIFGGTASRELSPSPAPLEMGVNCMTETNPIPIISHKPKMEKFPLDKVTDFKHVIYNLLVDHYNNPEETPFIEPVQIVLDGDVRTGFRFLDAYNPDKKLPELYAQHIRKARLDMENQDSVFIQDLYKFYLRACLELLSKYFEKADKYTFLDDELPLFVAGTSVKEAEARMKTMRTRARKRKSKEMKAGKRQNKKKCSWE